MAQECNNQEAREAYSTKGNSFKVPVTNVSIISKIIKTLINLPNLPKPPIPRGLILIGSTFRSGINSASMTARLLQKKQQYGIPTSPLPSGGENLDNIHDNLIMETVHDELVENAKVVGTNDNIAKGFVTTPDGVFPVFFKPGSISVIANIT
jgi:hypothetical protein